ncbi:MAG TPA: DUF1592 domain-containing protein [Chthoniobacteraceae bacterium]|jgi:hypothetical protein|nr:DUF1592 domain-containing protein [Chthoniobacteraceae bacterium]
MHFHPGFLVALLLLGARPAGAAEPAPKAAPVTFGAHIQPVLKQFCFDCHNKDKQKGDVDLVALSANAKLEENRETWEKVVASLESGDMPPEKKPQPTNLQRDLIVHFLDGQLTKIDCTLEKNPGRVTVRRLNRDEYKRTIAELVHVTIEMSDFPNDEVGFGFDNIADVLSISPMLMEKFMDAAEQVATKAVIVDNGKPQVKRMKAREFIVQQKGSAIPNEDGSLAFVTNADATRMVEFPGPGTYKLRIRAAGDQAGTEPAKMKISLDGTDLATVDVTAKNPSLKSYEVSFPIDRRRTSNLTISFINDFYDATNPDLKLRGDRNLFVESVDFESPPGAAVLPESHKLLIPTMPEPGREKAHARALLAPFLKRAYRRPVTPAEVERVARFVDLALEQKGTFVEGMQVALQAVLTSPQFLYRWELDESVTKPGEIRVINDYEIASRLSYFLWSSMPDTELFLAAEKGELRDEAKLQQQIVRMLKDYRANALTLNFADQWLQIRNLDEVAPDPKTFPKWIDEFRPLFKQETRKFFEAVMKEDRSVSDLLDADFTFLNDKLAMFYGIEGVRGAEFQRVQLPPNSPRGGVLTQAAVLMATSTPTRTSPVIRGKWILEQILGTPPPAPPANVPPLTEQKAVNQTASLRDRFSEHSKNAECAGCHKRMDPLGFALENFDAIGSWRDKDGKFPVDPSGQLTDGRKFANLKELKQVLKHGNQFLNCFTEKLMTYALGRGLDSQDRCAIRAVVDRAKKADNHFSALVTGIVLSDPFLKRKTVATLTKN